MGAVLLDIEGTTTPIAFVFQVLFPFARTHVADYLQRHLASEPVQQDLKLLQEEQRQDRDGGKEPPPWPESGGQAGLPQVEAYIRWLMDRDRKSTGLKSLQGKIWEDGFRSGKLRGQVYDDVPRFFETCRRQGTDICIFSSGSVLAQKLLFAHTTAGDLTGFIRSYFDTTTGPKNDAESYRAIAAALGHPPAELVFVSDVVAELDAARQAGLETVLCVRPGNPAVENTGHPVIETLDGLLS